MERSLARTLVEQLLTTSLSLFCAGVRFDPMRGHTGPTRITRPHRLAVAVDPHCEEAGLGVKSICITGIQHYLDPPCVQWPL